MKLKNNILFLSVISLIFFSFFVACDETEGDTTPPLIELNTPAEGAILKIGADIHLDMNLSDNEMLSSYRIQIHNNFTEHGHSHERAGVEENKLDTLFYERTANISGKKNTYIHEHIFIPENTAPGDYHFMVYCTDEAGNESFVVRNIELSHDGEEHSHD